MIVDGQPLANTDEITRGKLRNRYIGFVYQFHHLLPEFTARENVAMPLHIRGFSDPMIEKLVYNTLEQLNLVDFAEACVNTLSGGEKQKVAFARAYVTKPSLVLADEPTGNLDSRSGTLMMELFRRIHMQGTTLLIATHNESWLRRYPKRVLVLDKGRLIKDQPYGSGI